jgi:hypothetical protein
MLEGLHRKVQWTVSIKGTRIPTNTEPTLSQRDCSAFYMQLPQFDKRMNSPNRPVAGIKRRVGVGLIVESILILSVGVIRLNRFELSGINAPLLL